MRRLIHPTGRTWQESFVLNVGWYKGSASTKCANVSANTVIVDVCGWWMRKLIHPTGATDQNNFALNVGWHKRSASTKCANVSANTVIVDVCFGGCAGLSTLRVARGKKVLC